jgi:hypothetical protein
VIKIGAADEPPSEAFRADAPGGDENAGLRPNIFHQAEPGDLIQKYCDG